MLKKALMAIAVLAFSVATSYAATRFVATDGNDGNDGLDNMNLTVDIANGLLEPAGSSWLVTDADVDTTEASIGEYCYVESTDGGLTFTLLGLITNTNPITHGIYMSEVEHTGALPGVSAAADGSTGPWATFDHAVASTGAGTHTIKYETGAYTEDHSATIAILAGTNDVNLTIEPLVAGGTATISTSATASAFQMDATGCTVTFKGFVFDSASITQLVLMNANTSTLAFEDCTFTDTNAGGYWAQLNDGTARNLTFTDCTIESDRGATVLGGNFSLTGGSYKWTGNFPGVTARTNATSVTVATVALDGPDNTEALVADDSSKLLSAEMSYIHVTGCTGNVGRIYAKVDPSIVETDDDISVSYVGQIMIEGNTLTCKTTGAGEQFGAETNGAPTQTINIAPIDKIVYANNVITFDNAGANHCVFFAVGANHVAMYGNIIRAPAATDNYCVVIKSDDGYYGYNRIYYTGGAALYIAGGKRYTIVNNTAYSGDASAFMLAAHQDIDLASGTIGWAEDNIVQNNIFATAGTDIDDVAIGYDQSASSAAYNPQTWHNLIDRNGYWSAGINIAKINNVRVVKSAGDVSAITAQWAAYAVTFPMTLNDINSQVVNPNLMNMLGASSVVDSFSLPSTSTLTGAGTPSGMTIGAWQPQPRMTRLHHRYDEDY